MFNKILKNTTAIVLLVGITLNLGYIALSKAGFLSINTKTSVTKINTDKETEAGQSFVTNFIFEDIYDFQSWAIVQDNDGLMLFANKKGILTYDGQKENYVTFGKVPYALAKDPTSDKIFAGCNEGFGYLLKNKTGDYEYTSLSDSFDNLDFFSKIEFTDDKVWFYSEEMVLSSKLSDLSKTELVIISDKKNPFAGIMTHKNKIYINLQGIGVFDITEENRKKINGFDEISEFNILFSDYFDNTYSIIGIDNNQLYLFDGQTLKPFEIKPAEYIPESVLSGGLNLNSKQFVLYTTTGGAVVVNKSDGEIEKTFNYRTGLPDDEIYTAALDINAGLWLAHSYGLSRIDMQVPILNYGNYPGIIGKITSVKQIDTTLYVTATEGVFYLSKVKNFEDIEIITEKIKEITPDYQDNSRQNNSAANTNKTVDKKSREKKEETTTVENTNKNTGKKIWKRWKRKRKKKKDNEKSETVNNTKEETKTPAETETTSESPIETDVDKNNSNRKKIRKRTFEKETKRIYDLQSVKYVFKNIEGVSGKCKQVISYKGGILIVSNFGLFFQEKQGEKAKPIIENTYIYDAVKSETGDFIYVVSTNGMYKISEEKTEIKLTEINFSGEKPEQILSIIEQNLDTLWISGENTAYKISESVAKDTFNITPYYIDSNIPENVIVRKNDNRILFFISNKVLEYKQDKDTIIINKEITDNISPKSRYIFPSSECSIIKEKNNIYFIGNSEYRKELQIDMLQLFNRIDEFFIDNKNDIWIVGGRNFYKINPKNKTGFSPKFNLRIKSVTTATDTITSPGNIELNYDYGVINIKLLATEFIKQNSIEYSYTIEGNSEENIKWKKDNEFNLQNLSPGKYNLIFKARNTFGKEAQDVKLYVKINPPFWKTLGFGIAVAAIILALLFFVGFLIFKKRAAIMKKRTDELEAEVAKRTLEIRKQNEEISKQSEEIHASIRYASIIQTAVLPETKILDNQIADHFVLYLPRDIVSGDFYWIKKIENRTFIVAADCTGHGVPGGFLSMLGISFLNEIVNKANDEHKEINAADIVQLMREKVVSSLHQSATSQTKDGMDMSIAILNFDNNTLDFAGANNPMLFIRDEEITEIKADRMPVGYQRRKMDKRYTNQTLTFKKGDTFYLMSDGFQDQFGGEHKKRFMKKRLMQILLQIQEYDMPEQQKIMEDIFDKWVGEYVRVDDVLLMGIRI